MDSDERKGPVPELEPFPKRHHEPLIDWNPAYEEHGGIEDDESRLDDILKKSWTAGRPRGQVDEYESDTEEEGDEYEYDAEEEGDGSQSDWEAERICNKEG